MRHTFPVQPNLRSFALGLAALGSLGVLRQTNAQSWHIAAQEAAHQSPSARILVVDISSGHLLASHRLSDAARTLAAPGSTLKPLVLDQLVSAGRWDPTTRISCDRNLVVAGHRLACSHPPALSFDARQALTWSCNSYFAAVARTLRPGELSGLLRKTGLLGATGLAEDEAVAEFREPQSADQEQLTSLGVEGVRVTPLELAAAYRWLALELAAHPASTASQLVRAGLADSASFGMAGPASLGGVAVLGKTGTAEGSANSQTHGFFAGLAPAQRPQVVIVVYLPTGRGMDAARVAGELLAYAPAHASPGRP